MHRETAERHDHLLAELAGERVAALARISRTLETLIEQLAQSGARLAVLSGGDRAEELARHRQLRLRAVRYRWYLDVQRESLGLRHHESIERFYRVPDPITE